MSANQPTSFRYPFNLTGKIHAEAENAIRYAFSGLDDLNNAVRNLNTKVNSNTTAIAKQAAAGTTTVTNITGGGGTSTGTHSESLTDGNSNFIFAKGDIVTVVGVPN